MTLPKEIQSKYNLLKQATFNQIGLSETALPESIDKMFINNQKHLECKLWPINFMQEMAQQMQLAISIITKQTDYI